MPACAGDIALSFPGKATPMISKNEEMTSYALPTGPFANGTIPVENFEGPLEQTVWRIEIPGQSTLEMLQPLRMQLAEQGFGAVFECETQSCGGFDFRFGTLVMPEPEMHVDLGDFRFYAAKRGREAVSLMISRSSVAGFVQVIHIGFQPTPTAPVLSAPQIVSAPAEPGDIGTRLQNGGAIALDDLVFASGSAALSEGKYASLTTLAAWLKENPTLAVALVGHTDASGGLDGNIALSRKRAESVRQRLIQNYAIPARQVEAQGVGYLAPRASNLTDDGRLQNRRVEVMLTSTQSAP
jgi:outer membrane protein OmpA-like peptidoglycan-associated protein